MTKKNLKISLLVGSLIVLSAFFYKKDALTDTSSLLAEADGKSLFKSIFFSEGEIAKRLPEVSNYPINGKDLTSQKQERLDLLRQVIVEKIDEVHPAFFVRFKESVTSGDHLLIKAALYEALQYSNEILQQIVNGEEISPLLANLDGIVVEGPIVIDPVICYIIPMPPMTGLNPNITASVYSFPIASMAKENSLSTDRLINTIALNFKV